MLFIGIDLRHYESGNYVANDHISKRSNTVARKILFKSIQSIAMVSHYHPSHINDSYQRKKQSSERGTKKIAIATMLHFN
ncbi:transposase [uncultured Lactobacillus sp.]|uniref:transposase n=1 Tax=Limosilactobacillus vaginalis TaxID=1633 RepID=UPI0035A664C5